ncbi:MAG: glycoside hydrolase family 3 protein [Treponema sp.]|nr:glycoside hydrolase family 3 protein [Treponema sp.]
MKKLLPLTLSFLSLLGFFSCASSKNTHPELKAMTLHKKIGQLFVVRAESLDPSFPAQEVHKTYGRGVTTITAEILDRYQDYPAGGVVLFGKNIINPEQTKKLTQEIHNLNKIKTLIYVDEEGGIVSRVAKNPYFNLPQYADMRTIGDTGDVTEAYKAGLTIGSYLKEYGFDVDFAPVADVDTNPLNPIIGRRAFSSDPNKAAEMMLSFYKGLEAQGVKGCIKHFPGHGDTNTDSHGGYSESLKNWSQLSNCEMIPFKEGIKAGVDMIMTAHISLPQVDPSCKPATLSKSLLQGKLRKELGYKGLIISDAMEMGAITKEYSPGEAAIQAILAGIDLILIPYDYINTYQAVEEAVRQGRIPEKRIDESVNRILNYKKSL